jgi:hypothetical protein
VDFHEIRYAGDVTEDDPDATFFNLVASAIPKWRTFKLLRLVQRNPLITFDNEVSKSENHLWTLCIYEEQKDGFVCKNENLNVDTFVVPKVTAMPLVM